MFIPIQKKVTFLFFLLLAGIPAFAQVASNVTGKVSDAKTGLFLSEANVVIKETGTSGSSGADGAFSLMFDGSGTYTVEISKQGYSTVVQTFSISAGAEIDLGTIPLSPTGKANDAVVELSESEVENAEENSSESISGILHGSKDLYLSTAGYTFGPLRFKVRGYDNEYSTLYMNGIQMNDLESENPIWSLWGGLNDATRNSENYNGIHSNDFGYADIGGATSIDTRASTLRKQTKITYSYTNKTYTNRAMFIHSTGLMKNGWALSVSGSRRVSLDGVLNGLMESYVEGTYYDAWAYFVSAEKKINDKHSIGIVGFGSPAERGKQGGTTQEVYDLTGNNFYNPYWGWQDGKKRNSRTSYSNKPTGILSHYWTISKRTTLNTSVAYTMGEYSNTSLNWYNALDPRPDYYRYLPSYENMSDAERILATEKLTSGNAQIDWENLYRTNLNTKDVIANPNGELGTTLSGYRSEYIIERWHDDEKQLYFASLLNTKLDDNIELKVGVSHRNFLGMHYKTVEDLLGGDFIVDKDKYAPATNESSPTNEVELSDSDIRFPNRIAYEGDRFGYDYDAHIKYTEAWTQLDMTYKRFDVYLATKGSFTNFWRTGNMEKEAFPGEHSLGDSEKQSFINNSSKGGVVFKITGRHFLRANAMYETKAPDFRDSYLSVRTRNDVIPNLENEFITSFDGGYVLRAPKVKASLDVFYTTFENRSWNRSFYHDGYQNFVNYAITGINQIHQGAEFAGEITLFPGFTVQAVASLGYYRWTSAPEYTAIVDNNAQILDQDIIYAKGYIVDGTPQTAFSGGFQYWAPKFWNIGANVAYVQDRYLSFSPTRLTTDAVQNLTVGSEEYNKVVRQQLLPKAYTLDVFAGKSFQIARKYNLALNLNVSNVLDNKEIITGGYEQLRYDISSPDKFPAKYFYYYGRQYYLNINFRF